MKINNKDLSSYYLSKSINGNKYSLNDFSFFWSYGDGSPLFINSSKYDINNKIGYKSFVFCPMPKNGCSAWKQIMRRIKGIKYYLADDYWSLHSKENELEYDRIHRFGINGANKILYDINIFHAVFVRDSIERTLSAFLDKCIGSHWLNKYWCKPRTNPDNKITHKVYSHFDLYINSIVSIPPDSALDYHWLPQNFICDLYKFIGRYNIYYSKDIKSRYKFLMDIGGNKTWNTIGAKGWVKKTKNENNRKLLQNKIFDKNKRIHTIKIMGKNATEQMEILDLSGSFLDKESYHTINTSKRIFQFFRSDLIAKVIVYYQNDYILFNMTLPEWICKFLDVKLLIYELEKSLNNNNYNFNKKKIKILSYGEYSIYNKDYDHNAIINESNIIWNRKNELKKREKEHNTNIYMFNEMIEFDNNYNTIIHKIRGIITLYNILTFVDYKILPKCFRYDNNINYKNDKWDFTKSFQNKRKIMINLINTYFNHYIPYKNIKINKNFIFGGDEETFNKWRNDDKILYVNIQHNVLWMRDIPRYKIGRPASFQNF